MNQSIESLAFWFSSLFTTTDWSSTLITADQAPIHLSIFRSNLPSLVNKIPRYFNSSARGRDSSPTRESSTLFSVENHGLGCGRVDLHPGHFTLSCEPLQCVLKFMAWRSQQNHIIAKSRDLTLRFPNQIPPLHNYTCRSCLCKSKTGSITRGRPRRSPTCPVNEFDLVPRMRTQSSCFGNIGTR